MKENNTETCEQQKLWASLKDYGLIMRETLERELQTGLVCKHRIQEFLDSNNCNTATRANLKDFELHVTSTTSTFACLVHVSCHCGKHGFVVEPPRRNMKKEKESETSNSDEKKKWDVQKRLTRFGTMV